MTLIKSIELHHGKRRFCDVSLVNGTIELVNFYHGGGGKKVYYVPLTPMTDEDLIRYIDEIERHINETSCYPEPEGFDIQIYDKDGHRFYWSE